RARAGLALQVHDRGTVREELLDQLALGLATLDVVGTDVTDDSGHLVDPPVYGNDCNLRVDRFLQRRCQGIDFVRADDDAVDPLGYCRFDVGGLLGRTALTVAFNDLDIAQLPGLVLYLLHHVDEERKGEVWNRCENDQMLAGGLRWAECGKREADGACKKRRSLEQSHWEFPPMPLFTGGTG